MEYINKNRKIKVDWTVMKGTSACLEDFSRARVALFVKDAAHSNRWLVSCENDKRGHIVAELPESLSLGVYSLELIWLKNGHYHASRCVSRAQAEHIFAITDTTSEDNLTSAAVIRIKSYTESYGYDGLSGYEVWCLAGKYFYSEEEFYDRFYVKDEMNSMLAELRTWVETEVADFQQELEDVAKDAITYTDSKVAAEREEMARAVNELKSYANGTFATKMELAGKANKAETDSAINVLSQQIATKADKANVYTRAEVDQKVNKKQDALSFMSTPTATNRVVTEDILNDAVAKTQHYRGVLNAVLMLNGSVNVTRTLQQLDANAKKGEFYRANANFVKDDTHVHVGDIIISESNEEKEPLLDGFNWSLLHNEMDTDTITQIAVANPEGPNPTWPNIGTSLHTGNIVLGNAALSNRSSVISENSNETDIPTIKAVIEYVKAMLGTTPSQPAPSGEKLVLSITSTIPGVQEIVGNTIPATVIASAKTETFSDNAPKELNPTTYQWELENVGDVKSFTDKEVFSTFDIPCKVGSHTSTFRATYNGVTKEASVTTTMNLRKFFFFADGQVGIDETKASHFSNSVGCTVTIPAIEVAEGEDKFRNIILAVPEDMMITSIVQPDALNAPLAFEFMGTTKRVVGDNEYAYKLYRSQDMIDATGSKKLTIS